MNNNDYEYVDLGLPSGTLWATCNVGAESPEDWGDFLTWGEAIKCSIPTMDRMTELFDSTYTTTEWTTLNGINGYMITSKVPGYEGNSIFLPAGGCTNVLSLYNEGVHGLYWSCTQFSGSQQCSYCLYFDSSCYDWHYYFRFFGLSVRPVKINIFKDVIPY